MPNHFTVTIGQDPPYPCEYDVETNTLTAELPAENPIDQSRNITIQQNNGNTLHQQIWANAMAHLNAEGVFGIPAPPAPVGASPISGEDLASMTRDVPGASRINDDGLESMKGVDAPHPVLMGPRPAIQRATDVELFESLHRVARTSPDTVIAVQRVIINQMHSLYAVAVEDNEKMLAVMQQLLDNGETIYDDWRGEDG